MHNEPNINPVLDDRWFKWANWWVGFKPIFKKIALFSAIVLEAVLLLYSGYVWLDYFLISRSREKALYEELSRSIDYRPIHEAMAPQPIAVNFVVTLPAGGLGGAYDALAKLTNPNNNWLVYVSYQFKADNEIGPASEVLILNGEEAFVIGPGIASSPGAAADILISHVRWQRLRDWNKVNERKPRLMVSQASFNYFNERGRDSFGRVSFTVTNESIYNFWSVDLAVILYKGGQPIAARFTTIEQFRSGEERSLSLNIYNISAAVDEVLVVPKVNVTDPSVYMAIPGESIIF